MSEPITREETYLAAIAGDGVDLPNPITREELYLAAAAGMAVELPNPITRKEQFLQRVVETGGTGGGGVTIRNQNKTITQNGQYKADSGYTGLGTVTVAVPEPVLQDKTVTENGEYTADSGYDGLGVVTVNVAASGGGGAENEDALVTRTTTEYTNGRVEAIGKYLFYFDTVLKKATFKNAKTIQQGAFEKSKLESIDAPLVENMGTYAFANTQIEQADFPKCTTVGQFAFNNCSKLTYVNLPALTDILQNGVFAGCTALKSIELPNVYRMYGSAFYNCTSLVSVDLHSVTNIYEAAFKQCTQLTALILRSENVVALSNANAFQSTPFASGGTGGTVYVPSALITQYQQATNWATLYAAGTCNFVAIEGSEYE